MTTTISPAFALLPQVIFDNLTGLPEITIHAMVDLAGTGDPVATAIVQFLTDPMTISSCRYRLIREYRSSTVTRPVSLTGLQTYLFIGPGKEFASLGDFEDYALAVWIKSPGFWNEDIYGGETPERHRLLYSAIRDPLIENTRLTDHAWMPMFAQYIDFQREEETTKDRYDDWITLYPNDDLWLRILRNPVYGKTAMDRLHACDVKALAGDMDTPEEILDLFRPYLDSHPTKVREALKGRNVHPDELSWEWLDVVQDTESYLRWKRWDPTLAFPSWPPCKTTINQLIGNPSRLSPRQQESLGVLLQWTNYLSNATTPTDPDPDTVA